MLAAADESEGRGAMPYRGYLFRVLHAQGAHAAGGAMEYVEDGRMIGRFALVAYPARYRVTGVRTFIVSHGGAVFSRDLGVRTVAVARVMRRFDPDSAWRPEPSLPQRPPRAERMERVVAERGCLLCHRERTPGGDTQPLAPSWRDIAARYLYRTDAEQQLMGIVLEGADPLDRHWKDHADFIATGGNAPRVSSDEAHALARWILAR